MKTNVIWLSEDTYWDQTLLREWLKDCSDHTPEAFDSLEGAIVVIPGEYLGAKIDEINANLAKFKWCLVIITSDEHNVFPVDQLSHPNMKVYSTYPTTKFKNVDAWLPIGPARLAQLTITGKPLNWFFSGQINHVAREEYAKVLRARNAESDDGLLVETKGFAQGLAPAAYHGHLACAKVVPAPAGNISPDSFRLYEALEAGAVPVPQNPEFWNMLFPQGYPFPVIQEYEQLQGYMDDAIVQYPVLNNKVMAWWLYQKWYFKTLIEGDVVQLSGMLPPVETLQDKITVIIPTSPIKSHPSTEIIDETIASVRTHLPDCQIIITLDGVRPENENRRQDYEEFTRRLLWKCNHEYTDVLPIIFDQHTHQVGMAKAVMDLIKTPLLLYMEADTPLTPDMAIEWEEICNTLLAGTSNMVRFHFESRIPEEHMHMVHGMEEGLPINLMRTSQWSQRPHLASTAFYKRILSNHFSENAKSFIEDRMHGVLHEAYRQDGMLGWNQFRVHIYTPDGNIKRSYHTDGRAGEAKYDGTQVF